MRVTAQAECDNDETDGADEGDGTKDVDTLQLLHHRSGTTGDVDLPADDTKVNHAEGHLHQESRPPAKTSIDKKTSEGSTTTGTCCVDEVTKSLPCTTSLEADEIRGDNGRHGGQSTTTDTSQGSGGAQLPEGLRETAEEATKTKSEGSNEGGRLSSKDVTESTVERLESRLGQEVGGLEERHDIIDRCQQSAQDW